MPHKARVMQLNTDIEIVREMQRLNCEEMGIRHMLPKARHYLVKLESVRRPIVHILKEAFLASGGDAAVSREVITAGVTHSDVILMGTRKQFQHVLNALLEQGFGCKDLSVEIETALRNYDCPVNVPISEFADTRLSAMFGEIGKKTLVMGILNVTPDSFSDGGQFTDIKAAVDHAVEMVQYGADIIDIGGESTRPGSAGVSSEEETERVIPVIRALAEALKVPISVDTTKSAVAEAALDSGALIVNDISSGTFDPAMIPLVARKRCPAILQHTKGTPECMQESPVYDDLLGEVSGFLRERVREFVESGADERLLIIDPGIGFGKTVEHNLELLRRLRELTSIGRPILVGTSRKATIGKVLGGLPVGERMEGTAATIAVSIANGADIVRVHDVKEMCRVARMTDAIVRLRDECR
ncbi:MAG: dihydropteroate synthase [Armatimonadota bacterium]|nr:dihydropteroate synthase [bacterium]